MTNRFQNTVILFSIVLLSTGACATDLGGIGETLDGTPMVSMSENSMIVTGDDHACILLPQGNVRCWGSNDFGQLGTDQTGRLDYTDMVSGGRDVPLSGPAIEITAGSLHTCALLDSGVTECWGSDDFGVEIGSEWTAEKPKEDEDPVTD